MAEFARLRNKIQKYNSKNFQIRHLGFKYYDYSLIFENEKLINK